MRLHSPRDPSPAMRTPPRPTFFAHRRGFTFIEVMFAVLVLGVGVVMIAAMLPVAIRTTQETRDAAAGNAAVEAGFHLVETAALSNPISPIGGITDPDGDGVPQPVTWPAADTVWRSTTIPPLQPPPAAIFTVPYFPGYEAIAETFSNRVLTSAPEYMWLPFVARTDPDGVTQLAMVAVRARNISDGRYALGRVGSEVAAYDAFFGLGANGNDTLSTDNYPLPVLVTTRLGSADAGGPYFADDSFTLTLQDRPDPLLPNEEAAPNNDQIREAMVEGAAVVVVDGLGRLRVYRLGAPDTDDPAFSNSDGRGADTYFLAPDGELDRDFVDPVSLATPEAVAGARGVPDRPGDQLPARDAGVRQQHLGRRPQRPRRPVAGRPRARRPHPPLVNSSAFSLCPRPCTAARYTSPPGLPGSRSPS